MTEALFGFIGVIVGAIIPWVREWWYDKRQRKEHAAYLAVRIICVLDEYIGKCCEVVGDDGTYMGRPAKRTERGEEFYEVQVPLPPPPCYPDNVDWKSISSDLMYRILALPNKVIKAHDYIDACAENAFPPDYSELFEARQESFANLGLEAIDLTEILKDQYKLSDKGTNGFYSEWNPREYLEEKKSYIENRRAEYEKNHNEFIEKTFEENN